MIAALYCFNNWNVYILMQVRINYIIIIIIITYVRSISCVFAHLYTLVDDSEHPWTISCLFSYRFCSFNGVIEHWRWPLIAI